jgi:hypothetical protein
MPGGARGGEQTVRFTNIGRAPADLLGLQSAAAFAVTDSDCSDALAPGGSCTAAVRFEPDGYGRYEGTVELLTDHAPVPVSVSGGLATPQMTAAFAPAVVRQGALTTLRLTVTNPNPAQALFDVALDGLLPVGLELAGEPSFSADCGDPDMATDPGRTVFSLEDATILAGKACVVEALVEADLSGVLRFSTSARSHAGPSPTATAELSVQIDDSRVRLNFVPSVIGSPHN